jgi:hypothetical protein
MAAYLPHLSRVFPHKATDGGVFAWSAGCLSAQGHGWRRDCPTRGGSFRTETVTTEVRSRRGV